MRRFVERPELRCPRRVLRGWLRHSCPPVFRLESECVPYLALDIPSPCRSRPGPCLEAAIPGLGTESLRVEYRHRIRLAPGGLRRNWISARDIHSLAGHLAFL